MKTRILRTVALVVAAFALTNCFQVLHYLSLNQDGTVSVVWRLTISAAMKKGMKSRKATPSGKGSVAKKITNNFLDKPDELTALLKQFATRVESKTLTSKYDVTQEVRFTAKQGAPIPGHGGMPIFPVFKGKQLVLDFSGLAKKAAARKKAKAKASDSKKSGEKGPGGDKPAPPKKKNARANKIAAMILSTARYQIVLDGKFKAASAYVVNLKTGKQIPVRPVALGSQTLIDFPFLAALNEDEEKGFQLVINLK